MPTDLPPPRIGLALRRGFKQRCPNCGAGRLYVSYLKLVDHCDACGETFSHVRADDIPAYFTILIVGHLVVPLILIAVVSGIPDWISLSVCLPAVVVLTLAFLPYVKGVIAAHLWRLAKLDRTPQRPAL